MGVGEQKYLPWITVGMVGDILQRLSALRTFLVSRQLVVVPERSTNLLRNLHLRLRNADLPQSAGFSF